MIILPTGSNIYTPRQIPVATLALILLNIICSMLFFHARSQGERQLTTWLLKSPLVERQAQRYRTFLKAQNRETDILELKGALQTRKDLITNVENLVGEKLKASSEKDTNAEFNTLLFAASEKDSEFKQAKKQLIEHNPALISEQTYYTALIQASPSKTYGLVPKEFNLRNTAPWKLISYSFIHADLLHLTTNMATLFAFGFAIEGLLGAPLYLLLYLAGAVFAGLAETFANPDLTIPIIGASGAVAAIMGIFIVGFARSKIRLSFWIFPLPIFGSFYVASLALIIGWFALQAIGYFSAASLTVAYAAHLGGLTSGILIGLLMGFYRHRLKFPEVELSGKGLRLFYAGANAIERNNVQDAEKNFRALLQRFPKNVKLHDLIFQISTTSEAAAGLVVEILAALIPKLLARNCAERALDYYAVSLLLYGTGPILEPKQHLLLATAAHIRKDLPTAFYLYSTFEIAYPTHPDIAGIRMARESLEPAHSAPAATTIANQQAPAG